MRIVSARLERSQQRRWSPVHVAARVAEAGQALDRLGAVRAERAARRDALAAQAAARLWLPPARAARWLAQLDATLARLDAMRARLAACRDGFAALPQDDALPAEAPAPLAVGA